MENYENILYSVYAMRYQHDQYIVASELNDPICHSNECQIGSFSSEATICVCVYEGNKLVVAYHFIDVYLI